MRYIFSVGFHFSGSSVFSDNVCHFPGVSTTTSGNSRLPIETGLFRDDGIISAYDQVLSRGVLNSSTALKLFAQMSGKHGSDMVRDSFGHIERMTKGEYQKLLKRYIKRLFSSGVIGIGKSIVVSDKRLAKENIGKFELITRNFVDKYVQLICSEESKKKSEFFLFDNDPIGLTARPWWLISRLFPNSSVLLVSRDLRDQYFSLHRRGLAGDYSIQEFAFIVASVRNSYIHSKVDGKINLIKFENYVLCGKTRMDALLKIGLDDIDIDIDNLKRSIETIGRWRGAIDIPAWLDEMQNSLEGNECTLFQYSVPCRIDFSSKGHAIYNHGLSYPERFGRWTDGCYFEIEIPLAAPKENKGVLVEIHFGHPRGEFEVNFFARYGDCSARATSGFNNSSWVNSSVFLAVACGGDDEVLYIKGNVVKDFIKTDDDDRCHGIFINCINLSLIG